MVLCFWCHVPVLGSNVPDALLRCYVPWYLVQGAGAVHYTSLITATAEAFVQLLSCMLTCAADRIMPTPKRTMSTAWLGLSCSRPVAAMSAVWFRVCG